jgi:hypothetical protein
MHTHFIDPVKFITIKNKQYKHLFDRVEAGKKLSAEEGRALGELRPGDITFFDNTNLSNPNAWTIEPNSPDGVRIVAVNGRRVTHFTGISNKMKFEYRDTYGWSYSYFHRIV